MRLIDADKLVDMVESRPKHIAWGREIILETLRNAPTIEPKRGRWIIHDEFELVYCDVRCSNCGSIYEMDREGEYYNYCPNCGARMEGAE